jgi:N-acetylglucosaminyl-diphospho-decaprenol L-rhamnosyltransferase
VSWNTASLLERCLKALPDALGELRAEIVVVDNASSDGSADVAEAHADVTVIRNPSNVGYAKAMNQALAGTSCPVVIALNPDTEPPPKSLATLVERLESDPSVAVVVPRLTNQDGSTQHSVYRFPSPAVAAAVGLLPPRWTRGRIGRRFWLEGACPHDHNTDIDWAIGAVHVLRADALAGRRPYDERWFMYVEDIELCWWLAKRGWRRRLEADIVVPHVGNASGEQAWGPERTARWIDATYDWYQRDRGRLAVRLWAAVNTLGVLFHVTRGVIRRRDPAQTAGLRGVLPNHASVILRGARLPSVPHSISKGADEG